MDMTFIIEAKHTEYADLFEEFAHTYLSTAEGQTHLTAYVDLRTQARENFTRIVTAFEQDEAITDKVVAQLLPYATTPANHAAERWQYIAPAFVSDVRVKYDASGWTRQHLPPTRRLEVQERVTFGAEQRLHFDIDLTLYDVATQCH